MPRARSQRLRHRPASATPRRRAFTLLDLTIAVAIILIAAALVLPMARGTDTSRLAGAARMLVADLQYAQLESLAHPADTRLVVFETQANRYRIATSSSPNTPITHPVDRQPYQTTFGVGRAAHLAGVTFGALTLTQTDRVGFGNFGQLSQTSTAVIPLVSGSLSVTISLDPATGDATVSQAWR